MQNHFPEPENLKAWDEVPLRLPDHTAFPFLVNARSKTNSLPPPYRCKEPSHRPGLCTSGWSPGFSRLTPGLQPMLPNLARPLRSAPDPALGRDRVFRFSTAAA